MVTTGEGPATLRDALDAYSVSALTQMAQASKLDAKTGGRPGLINRLVTHILDRHVLQGIIDSLGQAERVAVEHILLEGGEVATEPLRQKLETEGLVGRASPQTGKLFVGSGLLASPDFRALLATLARRGLLLAPATYNKLPLDTASVRHFVPTDLRPLLAALLFPLRPIKSPPNLVAAQPEDLLRDVYILVSAARAEPIPLISGGWVSKRALVRLDAQMRRPEGADRVRSEAELQRFPLVRSLAEAAGLLQRSISGLTASETAASWMDLPAGKRLLELSRAYRKAGAYSELARLPGVRVSSRQDLDVKELPGRERVIDAIAALPVGTWVAISDLERQFRVGQYDFLMAYQSPYSGWSGYYHSPYSIYDRYSGYNTLQLTCRRDTGPTGWSDVEGQFVRQMVMHSLHLLGVVDVGGVPDGVSDRFRVTDVGASLLRGVAPALERDSGRMVVQPNFQILAFEPVPESVLYTLDRIADRVRIEQVAEYKITQESLGRALNSGMESEFAIEYLERHSGPLPQNVRRSIEEWGGRRNRIRVRRGAALLEVHDPAVLDRLLVSTTMAPMLADRPAPGVVVVRGDAVEALYDLLASPSSAPPLVLPALSEGEDGAWQDTVHIDDAGTIQPRMRWPSLFLIHELERIAEPRDTCTFQITRSSVRSATRAGYDNDAIRGLLERISHGPLPESVIRTIRHGTYRWGRTVLAPMLLLETQTPEIMAEMRADDEIGPLIEPIAGATTIARVAAQHADTLRAVLADRGAELHSP